MTVSREAVVWGFRFFLGRDPGDEDAIKAHMALKDEMLLAETLIRSAEFATSKRFNYLLTLKQASPPAAVRVARVTTSTKRILIIGNCQARGLARLIQAMTGDVIASSMELLAATMNRIRTGELDISALIAQQDLVFVHPNNEFNQLLEKKCPAASAKIRIIPSISYAAFHPDLVYVRSSQMGNVLGPLGEYQSALTLYGWLHGFSETETAGLFSEDVFDALGYFDYADSSKAYLLGTKNITGIPLDDLLSRWSRQGCWMHSVNHPKLFVLADLARVLLARNGIEPLPDVEQYVEDNLADGPAWPVYPEIGKRMGIKGHYLFKRVRGSCSEEQPVLMVGLKDFIHESFAAFSKYRKEDLICERLASSRYQGLPDVLNKRKIPPLKKTPMPASIRSNTFKNKGENPYRSLPDHQFWRRAVERLSMNEVDPIIQPRFTLKQHEKIATAGSCFAQHISRTLIRQGFNYYVAERGDGLSPDEQQQRNFGVFSARYGNLYTTRQLVQLFDRAYGTFLPRDNYWDGNDGRFFDPFRPQIEPNGFASIDQLESSRSAHLTAVREMFENLDVFVFTLGLTEAWRNRIDGAVYPLAPGVVAGVMDHTTHEFVNFTVSDVVEDLQAFIVRLLQVNARAKIILTVSPVPLIATYENRHVLVSTTYSKSALRAAAEEICRRYPLSEYFPSYEIITGNFTRGTYFDNDLRSVTPEGVDHVMKLFVKHYSSDGRKAGIDPDLIREAVLLNDVICDEEAIDAGCG